MGADETPAFVPPIQIILGRTTWGTLAHIGRPEDQSGVGLDVRGDPS